MAGPDEESNRSRQLKAARERVLAYADPDMVARDLAQRMVVASRKDKNTIELKLDDIYNSVHQRKAIYSELERISYIVSKQLGDRATGVVVVNVYFGSKLARQIYIK